ncbi:MAG TPA: BamA/TamA family outer membrane protein [Methylomirabilota bacterium]|nr:BamA/TamA family outer membrane protein [Methylomirabilota bacterium]
MSPLTHRPCVATLFAFLILLASFPVHAQSRIKDNIDQQLEDTKAADQVGIGQSADDDSFSIYGMPIPILNPTIGYGLAAAGLMTFRLDSEDKVSPRSTVAMGIGYTNNRSYAFGAGTSLYLDEDRYRVNLISGYGDVNLKFFGVGNNSFFQNHPVDFSINGAFTTANARARVADHFYIGPLAKYLDSTVNFDLVPATVRQRDLDFRLAGAGAIAEYDSRDTSFSPHAGTYGELEAVRFDQRIGSDFDFFHVDGSVAHYMELTSDLVLAGQVRAATATGNAPIFALPFITLRGFPGGKYLDNITWQAQAELRWRAFWRIGFVAFAGAGQIASNLGDFAHNDLLYSGGVGIRFVASESERVNLGIDYAHASDGESAFYFRIGEAF